MTNCWKDPAPRNTLVTFNYDLVVEDSLRRMRIPYDYGFREDHVDEDHESLNAFGADLALLKIHGSLNWSICEHKGPAPMEQTEINFDRIHLYKDFRALSQRASQPLLVPPTWRKIPIGPLGDVWNRAVGAIASATRIIVLGYSMPTIDQHFKYLLAAGLQRNISLRNILFVNPALAAGVRQSEANSQEILARIRNVLRPELEDRGIVKFEPWYAENFFFEQGHRAKINRSGPPRNEDLRPSPYSESSSSS